MTYGRLEGKIGLELRSKLVPLEGKPPRLAMETAELHDKSEWTIQISNRL